MKRDSSITSKIMSSIPSKDTQPEICLGKILSGKGIRYRKHYKIAGRPDFAIVAKKIAIFVDGDFWHGHNWKLRGFKNLKSELASYKIFWANKIRNNIKRDTKANKLTKAPPAASPPCLSTRLKNIFSTSFESLIFIPHALANSSTSISVRIFFIALALLCKW